MDGLASLVDKSLLIQRERADGEPRFYMLATVREFGLERLAAAGEEAATRRAHAEFYLDLAERAEPELIGPEQGRWLDRLDADLDNFRSVRTWATRGVGDDTRSPTPAEIGLRLAGALWRFLMVRGYLAEGRGWLEEALAAAPHAPAGDRAKALQHLGNTTLDLGDYPAARAHYEAAAVLRRELGDELGVASSLNGLGLVTDYLGDYDRAQELHEEALALRRRHGDRLGLGNSLSNLGNVAVHQGDLDRARRSHEEALAVRRAMGDTGAAAFTLFNLGGIARLTGDAATARALFAEALAVFREVGDKLGVAYALYGLAQLDRDAGETRPAAARLAEVLGLRREMGDQRGLVEGIEEVAAVAAVAGRGEDAARLLAAADARRAALGAPLPPADRADRARTEAALRRALPPGAFAAASAAGAVLPLAEAVDLAAGLAADLAAAAPAPAPPAAPSPAPAAYPAGLSHREVEVLRLVAAGLTNAQIGERLFISPRTVNAHLNRIYAKIDVTSRTAATRFAMEHDLAG